VGVFVVYVCGVLYARFFLIFWVGFVFGCVFFGGVFVYMCVYFIFECERFGV